MSVLKYFDKVNHVWRKVGSGGGGGGTDDYLDLANKPKINNTVLAGNKTASDLGLEAAGAVAAHENDSFAHASEIEAAVSDHNSDSSAHSSLFSALSSLYAAISHNHSAANITSGTLPISRGGTGQSSFSALKAAIVTGSTSNTLTTRTIRDNVNTARPIAEDAALITSNTLRYAINRTTSVAVADNNVGTYMARGIAAGVNDIGEGTYLDNGLIYLVYEE